MKKRIADLVSNTLNPFFMSLGIIGLVSFASAPGTVSALKWALLAVALSVLPVFLAIIYLVRKGKIDTIYTDARRQRTGIYLLAGLIAAAGGINLIYLGAPLMLRAAFLAGFSGAVIFTGITWWWKVSLHTAMVAAAVTILVILHGWLAVIAAVIVPLMAWARVASDHHSPAQTVTGAILGALVVILALYPFVSV
ncbi:MAG: hypothetical protein U1B77_02590 [Dehalococcoidales bacterium]|nr:hypothetical protein [Dehalococcoidales bacterium]